MPLISWENGTGENGTGDLVPFQNPRCSDEDIFLFKGRPE